MKSFIAGLRLTYLRSAAGGREELAFDIIGVFRLRLLPHLAYGPDKSNSRAAGSIR